MARTLALLLCLAGLALHGHAAASPPIDPFASSSTVSTGTNGAAAFSPKSPAASPTASAPAAVDGLALAAEYAAAPGAQPAEQRLTYKGVATTGYTSTPLTTYGATNLGCALGYVGDNFTSDYVAMGPSFFNQGYSCGLCIRLECDDARCEQPGRTRVAQVLDYCGNCYDADLTIAQPLFVALTGRQPSPNPSALISWEFVDCAPYSNGTIKMLVKQGGSAYYQAFSFANSIYTITAAQLNGDRLVHGTDNYWSWNPVSTIDPAGPFTLDILGSNGQVLQVVLPALVSTDLGLQFTPPAPVPAPSAE
uniref:Expansin-like EG45 domain-containing protein n=1 Tax=Auxenochlorella protothecoides TaxID=3075 RepID=A0A1D1ZQJ3_AUXPR